MLVHLSISSWSGQKLDRRATNDLTVMNAMGKDTAKVVKSVISKDVLKPCNTAVGQLRDKHKALTLPYDDAGARILPTAGYFKYVEEVNKLISNLNDKVEELISNFEMHKQRARLELNGMFNEADYPDAESIRHKFRVDMQVRDIPCEGNFVVNMSEEIVSSLKDSMVKQNESKLEEAQREVWKRVIDRVGNFASKMAEERANGKPGIFRDTTVSTLHEILDLAPSLNLAEDPSLTALVEEIKQSLGGYNPDELRLHPDKRAAAADKAKQAVSKLETAMAGAF